MIKCIKFSNFRNLNGEYYFGQKLNIVIGKNSSGKSNLLDGIRSVFSAINDDYFRVEKSDFVKCNDRVLIVISVELELDSIPTLNYYDAYGSLKTGFIVTVRKTQRRRCSKEVSLLNGSNEDNEILKNDKKVPNVTIIPLSRIDSLFTIGMTASISNFLSLEKDYCKIKGASKEQLKKQLQTKINEFNDFCKKFGQNFDVAFADPKISDEKIYAVDADISEEHSYKIGSGYKRVANIIINSMHEGNNIILINEIENHLHPSLIRTLIREIQTLNNSIIIGTTYSAVEEDIYTLNEKIDFINIFLSTNRNLYLKYSQILTGSVNETVDKLKKVITKLSEEYHVIDYELKFMSFSIFLKKVKEASDGLLGFYYNEYGNHPIEFGDLL